MIRIENLYKLKAGPPTDGTETVYVQKELFPEDEVKAEKDKGDDTDTTLKNLLTQSSLTTLTKLGSQDTSGFEEEISTITNKYLSFVASKLGVKPELLLQLAPRRIVSSEVTLNGKNGEAKQFRPDTVAGYITSINLIIFNPGMISFLKVYSNGELCTHEHEHFVNALQRTVVNVIDPQAIRLAVKDYFLDRLINGDISETFYIPTVGLRKHVGDFFAGIVDNLGNSEDKRIGKDGDGDSNLSQTGREELRKHLKSHNDYQDLLKQYDSEEDALKSVEKMIDNIITGYEIVTGTLSSNSSHFRLLIPPDVIDQDKLSTLVKEVSNSGNLDLIKQEAIQSAKEFADCMLGNIYVQTKLHFGRLPNKEDMSRYFFSLEETQCYLAQTKWALENENLTSDERAKMECRIQLFMKGKELVELERRASVAEQNPIVVKALNRYKSTKRSLKEVKESIDAQLEQIIECQQIKDCTNLTDLTAKEKELKEEVKKKFIVADSTKENVLRSMKDLLDEHYRVRLDILSSAVSLIPEKKDDISNLVKDLERFCELRVKVEKLDDDLDGKWFDPMYRLSDTPGNNILREQIEEKELEIAQLSKKAKHDELRMVFPADGQRELPFWQSTQHLII